jgi:hypothetical protein
MFSVEPVGVILIYAIIFTCGILSIILDAWERERQLSFNLTVLNATELDEILEVEEVELSQEAPQAG